MTPSTARPSTLSPNGAPAGVGGDGSFRIGLLQFAPQVRSERENVRFIRSAVRGVTDATIVLPEFFLGSYRTYPLFFPEQDELARPLEPLLAVSVEQRLRFVGSLPVRSHGRNFNRALVVGGGTISTAHDKVRLFGPELDVFSAGRSPHRLIDIGGLPSTVQICMDIADPVPVRAAAGAGVRLVLSPSTVSVAFLRVIHQARALENQVVSVFCNRHGVDDDGTVYLGRSGIFLPDGTDVSVRADGDELALRTVRAEQLAAWSALQRGLVGSPAAPPG
ncbi:carbon-nitrogen hydrolase family protein [Actinomadura sp. NEAU-AAG7]|uniref:carbon-nitrogen hydrolase family protein n=1 Tax=Actinomadura sp. NEAU-AAG7 TaxID=2839640 RepID=UPI001BE4682D|nr:carbon-nitrogen hydrolase family protein [Actinomadura sp. NEAU-AAG7]MBT2212338.1 carbon-nitrogen hydrolase family protein [Actinomadura sp. NEAU-AAG7]